MDELISKPINRDSLVHIEINMKHQEHDNTRLLQSETAMQNTKMNTEQASYTSADFIKQSFIQEELPLSCPKSSSPHPHFSTHARSNADAFSEHESQKLPITPNFDTFKLRPSACSPITFMQKSDKPKAKDSFTLKQRSEVHLQVPCPTTDHAFSSRATVVPNRGNPHQRACVRR